MASKFNAASEILLSFLLISVHSNVAKQIFSYNYDVPVLAKKYKCVWLIWNFSISQACKLVWVAIVIVLFTAVCFIILVIFSLIWYIPKLPFLKYYSASPQNWSRITCGWSFSWRDKTFCHCHILIEPDFSVPTMLYFLWWSWNMKVRLKSLHKEPAPFTPR